ncbi:galectin-3-binding protein A-like [Brienomyrus brachyistius]|uniref:galectin-3-binding protein A-like n=1 Tax=Brienomyrus brachyistius TaxID=42636 RepID=UPI0020B21FE0|nr:galectin-3-binding protein A-like [Brienomyrus brachyistius]XP_048844147.1 galectin-3-binding protein A-like [Brienomyrus brachyistius]
MCAWTDCFLLFLAALSLVAGARDGDVRLVGGQLSSEGRVEVFYGGQWGTVCDDGWGIAEAQVVCRQLGLPGALSAVSGGKYGQGSGPIWLDDMECTGDESDLPSCCFKGWGVSDCTHSEDAGVVCERDTALNNVHVYAVDDGLNLSQKLGKLWDSGTGCDVNIVVQSPNRDPADETFCTHRLILSLDPDFTFISPMQRSSNLTMLVSSACRPYVSSFLRYLYTRQIGITIASVLCLHQMASEFGVKQLQADSARLYPWLLPEDDTFGSPLSMYDDGVRTGDRVLQEVCLQYLAWNCEALINSTAWSILSTETLQALLSRSDLIVPDEPFLLNALESWFNATGNETGPSTVAALLGNIRFSMISADTLYDLQFTSDMYKKYTVLYDADMVEGYPFHVLSFQKLKTHMDSVDVRFSPRTYTRSPWGYTISATEISNYKQNPYNNPYNGWNNVFSRSFTTPVFNNVLLQNNMVTWTVEIYFSTEECALRGYTCNSGLAARLYPSSYVQNNEGIDYNNRVVMVCDSGYIFHVQDFKDNMVYLPANSTTGQTYPCFANQYSFQFVIRPEYKM